jgi:hypothetical protein
VLLTQRHLLLRRYYLWWGRDSSAGIATGYGQDGPGIESQWGRDFSHMSRPVLGPAQPPVQWVPVLLEVKRPGLGADHPPPPSAEVTITLPLDLWSLL